MPLADGAELPGTTLAVQIENHPAARPARNLGAADMVIEATVEGDSTRFTALFLCDETIGLTGPVRSARYYNIDLWQDLHVLTVGFGRSNGAQARFVAAGMPFPNGMEGWSWFRRHGPRPAPHNVYLDVAAMQAALTSNDALARLAARVDQLRPPFRFSDEPALPESGRQVTRVDIATTSWWQFGWTWDPAAGAWLRSDAGQRIRDEATDERVAARSVIVQRVTQETVYGDPDSAGSPRRLQHLVGSGDGTAYIDGRAYPLRWERASASDGTAWTFAETGAPVELPPGQVWLEILPLEASLVEG